MRMRRPPRPSDVLDGGEGLGDAAIIGDFSGFDGDVEIDSHENFFSADVRRRRRFFWA